MPDNVEAKYNRNKNMELSAQIHCDFNIAAFHDLNGFYIRNWQLTLIFLVPIWIQIGFK